MTSAALVPLPAQQLAAVAPNWTAMRSAIVACERIDEVRSLADKALALRAYFAQSQDVDNEVAAMRIRLRAERRLGELIAQEQEAGRLAKASEGRPTEASSATTLSAIGIPRDRSARAQELARVPEAQFEAALQQSKPSARKLAALAPAKTDEPQPRIAQHIDVRPVLKTWGVIRDFHAALNDGSLLPALDWDKHPGIQQFQRDEIRSALHGLIAYLTALRDGVKHDERANAESSRSSRKLCGHAPPN